MYDLKQAQKECGISLAPDTPILMFNGSVKKAKDIVVGDLLMGSDSKPRTVASLTRGEEEMFEIIQSFGIPYTVGKNHMLSLVVTGVGKGKIMHGKDGRDYWVPLGADHCTQRQGRSRVGKHDLYRLLRQRRPACLYGHHR